MVSYDLLRLTTRGSLGAQIVLGAISCFGFLGSQSVNLLFVSLILDTTVQGMEIIYYAVTFSIERPPTRWRYADWFFSTPTMLVATIMYQLFLQDQSLAIDTFVTEYGLFTACVIALDVLMLIFGLLAELGWVDKIIAIGCGMVPFVLMYVLIFVYIPTTAWGYALLSFQMFVWGLYGVAALFAYHPKNIMYNCLDVFSKNIYGIIAMITSFVLE